MKKTNRTVKYRVNIFLMEHFSKKNKTIQVKNLITKRPFQEFEATKEEKKPKMC